jgi:Flp pilus assembly protein CpaB
MEEQVRSVTLLVSPEQAALLDLGQNLGNLTLSLRNPEDRMDADTRPATLADIRFRQESPAEPSPGDSPAAAAGTPLKGGAEKEPDVFQIATLRGSQRGGILVTVAE